ncbi:MAG: IS630 family transposase [Methanomassiliicoccales archaeon]|nr:IS630 family transposase [Methanomassiliicoccales archaeon]
MTARNRESKKKKDISEREWKRRKGYELLRAGVRKADIARTLDVDWKTVKRWERRREGGGADSWKDVKQPGKPSKLSGKQRQMLMKILIKGALARGYPTDLWTLKRVAEVIRQEFGVEYNVTHVWRVLRDMGFSSQVPQLVAKEKNDVFVSEWLKKEWPKIRAFARRKNATILFLDESCVQSRPNVRRTWAPAGARPVMRVKEGERNKLSLISAVSDEAELYFRIHTDNITGTEIMAFLKHLLKEIDGNIVLLWDNGGPHRRVDVKQFLYENRKRLYTKRFPAYAPELNPDEQIWNVLKYQELSNWCPDTVEEMKARVKGVMSRLKRNPERIRIAMVHSRLPLPSIHTCRQ